MKSTLRLALIAALSLLLPLPLAAAPSASSVAKAARAVGKAIMKKAPSSTELESLNRARQIQSTKNMMERIRAHQDGSSARVMSIPCRMCNGRGYGYIPQYPTTPLTCPQCNGSGVEQIRVNE